MLALPVLTWGRLLGVDGKKEIDVMCNRTFLMRSISLTMIASILIFSSALSTASSTGGVRLEPSVLANSRGNNQGSNYSFLTCDPLNGNYPCSPGDRGAPCVTCDTFYYLAILFAGGGYREISGAGTCGRNMSGTCDGVSTQCQNANTAVGVCKAPAKVSVQP